MGMSRYDMQDYVDYRRYLLSLGEDNSRSWDRLKANLRRALMDELTPRQRQLVIMYFVEGWTMTEIAKKLGVNVSTVSRTVRRGKERLRRCLRYGAKELLSEEDE